MKSIIRYTLITAKRDWLFLGLFVITSIAIAISIFLGSTALVEQQQMAIAYASGASRLILIIGLILFVCFHVQRSFDNRELEVILSRPISRTSFVIAYWLGFVVLGVSVAVPLIVALWLFTPVDPVGLLYWGGSLILEIGIMLAFALRSALILQRAVTSVLSAFGFYVLARMMGFFTATIKAPVALKYNTDANGIIQFLLEAISIIFPRLDLYGKSAWLIYGIDGAENLWIFQVQSLIYIPLLLAVAIFDFQRKQF